MRRGFRTEAIPAVARAQVRRLRAFKFKAKRAGFPLTDQHGTRINDLLGESYSVVLVLEYDEA